MSPQDFRARHLPLSHNWLFGKLLTPDGRNAQQFHASVAEYLAWRSGASWRPLADRFHPDKVSYTQALNLLNEARVSTDACGCPYCAGSPFAGERRPVTSDTGVARRSAKAGA